MIFDVVRSPWTTSAVCIEATAEPMRVMRFFRPGVGVGIWGGVDVDVDVDVDVGEEEECNASSNISLSVHPVIHSIYISPRASSTKYTAGTVTPPPPTGPPPASPASEVIRDLSSSRRMRTRRRASERHRCFVRRASRMG